jgi:hypothetical protein
MTKDSLQTFSYETELYLPVKRILEKNGYTVRGEVTNVDIAAVKGNQLVAIEMKKVFNLELLFQCIDRQRTANSVYLAIPRPDYYGRTAKWRKVIHLARRLELGIIIVCSKDYAEIVLHPKAFDRNKSRRIYAKKRFSIIDEISERSFDGNTGGSTRRKLMTAYREKCIVIAKTLKKLKAASPGLLIEHGTDQKKTGSILQKNFYGWFDKTERGIYTLSLKARKEIKEFL